MQLSIIIVAYKNQPILERCLESIPKRGDWEVVVVDNSAENRGFAKGCNLGAQQARGELLFFLNPDTEVHEAAIERMSDCLQADGRIGIVAPMLLDDEGIPYLSYSRQPTWLTSWVVYSVLNRLFWGTRLVQEHWMVGGEVSSIKYQELSDREKEKTEKESERSTLMRDPLALWRVPVEAVEVEIASGAALMVRRKDFVSLGGFDERFFMYWEEVDLCRRYLAAGQKIVYLPSAKITHSGGLLTPVGSRHVQHWFRQSRAYFFGKHFGWLRSKLLQTWLLLLEEWKLVLVVLGLGVWLWRRIV